MAGFDIVGKDTGPGKAGSGLIIKPLVSAHLLYNYNIDGNMLKPEHKDYLIQHVVPFLKEHRVHAKLIGTASQSGDREYNRQLSLGRVLRVKEFLSRQGIPEAKLPGPDIHAAGEDLSTSHSIEDELDRAVRINIALGIKPLPLWPTIVIPILITPGDPTPIEHPPVVITGDVEQEPWAIRQMHGSQVGIGVSAEAFGLGIGVGGGLVEYHFLLVHRRTKQMAQCRFFGPAGSTGAGPGGRGKLPPKGPGRLKKVIGPSAEISFTMASKKWNNFSTKKGVGFSDFEGRAVWHDPADLGLGTDISVTATLDLPHLGITVGVDTGKTVGFPSSSVSTGDFRCKPPVQLKF
jgi:hypothetical protein